MFKGLPGAFRIAKWNQPVAEAVSRCPVCWIRVSGLAPVVHRAGQVHALTALGKGSGRCYQLPPPVGLWLPVPALEGKELPHQRMEAIEGVIPIQGVEEVGPHQLRQGILPVVVVGLGGGERAGWGTALDQLPGDRSRQGEAEQAGELHRLGSQGGPTGEQGGHQSRLPLEVGVLLGKGLGLHGGSGQILPQVPQREAWHTVQSATEEHQREGEPAHVFHQPSGLLLLTFNPQAATRA